LHNLFKLPRKINWCVRVGSCILWWKDDDDGDDGIGGGYCMVDTLR